MINNLFITPSGKLIHIAKYNVCNSMKNIDNFKLVAYCGCTCGTKEAEIFQKESIIHSICYKECQRCKQIIENIEGEQIWVE